MTGRRFASATLPQNTCDCGEKPAPSIVSETGLAGRTGFGDTAVIVGPMRATVKGRAFDRPAVGLNTVTAAVPAAARSGGGMTAVSRLGPP